MHGFITLSDVKSYEPAHVIFVLIRYASSDGSEARLRIRAVTPGPSLLAQM